MLRRSFLGGLGLLAAPAVIRTPGLLMPISRVRRMGVGATVTHDLPRSFFGAPTVELEVLGPRHIVGVWNDGVLAGAIHNDCERPRLLALHSDGKHEFFEMPVAA